MKLSRPAILLSWLLLADPARAALQTSLQSPDGRIAVSMYFSTNERPSWSAAFRGQSILKDCRLGLRTVEDGELMNAARVISERRQSHDQTIPRLFGKSSTALDRYNEVRLTLENTARRQTDLVFRCYDDAVAFRYELSGSGTATILEESTAFRLDREPKAFAQYLEHFKTSHEHTVTLTNYAALLRGKLLDLPLTLSWSDGTYVALTEAALRQYAGMALRRVATGQGQDELVAELTPRPDGTKVVRSLPLQTPWRVALIAERPGLLLESGTLYCLNEPPAIEDLSWIKPGKITFHWWNGDVFDGKPGAPILSLEMAQKYIDFCASNNLPIHSLTSTEGTTTPWYHQSKPGVEPGSDTDVTRPREGFDLPAIRRYADAKGIRLWTWVHQAALRGRVDEAFAAFEKMGWSGMMVDFFDHDDQETVEFAESVLRAAARHKILIHLHGVWKPTGLERTFPNLMNHEGALNLEYLKWSDLCTPEHSLNMAFTRLIAGPMDYHLGGFRAVPRSEFKPRHVAPHVLGTRCHQLAMYVCFDNPAPMVADYPAAYLNQPGFDLVQRVPTWWDETKVLIDEVGEWLVTARRKDTRWYIGGLSAKRERQLRLPLGFLGPGEFVARIWKDAPDAAAKPNALETQTTRLEASQNLELSIAVDGGFVAELTPISRN